MHRHVAACAGLEPCAAQSTQGWAGVQSSSAPSSISSGTQVAWPRPGVLAGARSRGRNTSQHRPVSARPQARVGVPLHQQVQRGGAAVGPAHHADAPRIHARLRGQPHQRVLAGAASLTCCASPYWAQPSSESAMPRLRPIKHHKPCGVQRPLLPPRLGLHAAAMAAAIALVDFDTGLASGHLQVCMERPAVKSYARRCVQAIIAALATIGVPRRATWQLPRARPAA